MRAHPRLFGWLLTLAACVSMPAFAQSARSGGGASAQLVQQLQQLGSERTQLQAENARLKQDLEAMRKERDSLESGKQAAGARERASAAAVAHGAQERDQLQNELAEQKKRMQELIVKFRETAENLRKVETERAAATQSLSLRDAELKNCVGKNQALYTLNDEVLDRMEHQGLWSQLVSKEPFTQIQRTRLENLADEYRQRAEDQKIPPPASPPAAAR